MKNSCWAVFCAVMMAMVLGATSGCDGEEKIIPDGGADSDTTKDPGDTIDEEGTDTDIESDSSSVDTEHCEDSDDPSYVYETTCIGEKCTAGSCCEGSTCGEAIFGGVDQGILANYCFPKPNELATDVNPCQCGDMAVQFQLDEAGTKFWTACIAKGEVVSSANVKFPIMSAEYIANAPGGQLDPSDIRQFPATVIDAELTSLPAAQQPSFVMGFGIEDFIDLDNDGEENDQAMYLILQGVKGLNTMWMTQTMVPGDKWAAGTLVNPTEQSDGSTNFYTSLLKGDLAGQKITRMWIEALVLEGDLIIETAPEVCGTKGGVGCTEASIGYDLGLGGVRAELEMSE